MKFEFATATRIVFGRGRFAEIGQLAASFGKSALIVTGKSLQRAQPLVEQLRRAGVANSVFSITGEPKVTDVRIGTERAKAAQCELVIGFGGGSAIDCGKAIAAMLTNSGDVLDHLEVVGKGQAIAEPAAPFIAIPTTAGAGAEVTKNAVLMSPEHSVKASMRSVLMLPRVALVDPELTIGLPPEITAATGMDALTQVIEPYTCCRSNPLTDALCRDAIPRIARSLKGAFENGKDLDAREDMALGSLLGGLALANSGLGAVHGFAAPLGGMFPAPHGAVCAALLPPVMEANLKALRERYAESEIIGRYEEIARWLTQNHDATAEDGVDWISRLGSDLSIPPLREYGISKGDLPDLVQKAAAASSMKANPLPLTETELDGIVRRVW
ncbi:MAG: iron-containing alcohol dehydrogenase [Limisphaerales bacterium]